MTAENLNKNEKPIAPREPLLNKADVISRFGECKYSCELTHEPSWFHTVILNDWTFFIEEWMDCEPNEPEEFICVIYNKDKRITGYSDTNLVDLISYIEKHIQNGL